MPVHVSTASPDNGAPTLVSLTNLNSRRWSDAASVEGLAHTSRVAAKGDFIRWPVERGAVWQNERVALGGQSGHL
jgi:hypothetical protein